MWKKLFQKSPSRQAQFKTLSPCHTPSSQLTKRFVSLRFSLAHQDFLIEKTPVSLDLKQIFKIRFVKQGSIKNICIYSSGFSIFLANYPSVTELCTQYTWTTAVPKHKVTSAQTLAQLHSPHWKQNPQGQTTLPSSALMQVTQELVTTTQK